VISQADNAKELLLTIFGGLAVVVVCVTLDPWLCVSGFHRVCLYRMFLSFLYLITLCLQTLQKLPMPSKAVRLGGGCKFAYIS